MGNQNTRPQPSAEPVAYLYERPDGLAYALRHRLPDDKLVADTTIAPLYPASALEAARREALEQAEWVPLSQDDAETELWLCLRGMFHQTDDKSLIAEMRKRNLWVYGRADRTSDEDEDEDEDEENPDAG